MWAGAEPTGWRYQQKAALECICEVLAAMLRISPLGQSLVLKGVTLACLLSCLYREQKAPSMELRTARAMFLLRKTSTFQEEQMIPVFQELCALIYEPALLPLNRAIPQAKSPVLISILLHL